MGDKNKLTPQEKLLVEFFANKDIINESPEKAKQVGDAIVGNIGNMKLNKKLSDKSIKSEYDPESIKAIRYFLFKTKNAEASYSSAKKLDVIIKSEEAGQPIKDFEKLSVAEFGFVQNLRDIEDPWSKILSDVAKKTENPKLNQLVNSIDKAEENGKKLQTLMDKDGMGLKGGDIAMYKTDKKWSIKQSKGSWMGHEGRLEEAFLSKYNHAAPILTSTNSNNEKIAYASDVWGESIVHKIPASELIQSDVFRVDVSKLVSKERVAQLEKIDYGTRLDENKNEVKITWKEVMQERYENLSNAMHKGQVHYQLHELSEKGEALVDKGQKNEAKIAELEKKLETGPDKNYEEKEKIEKEIKKLTFETEGIEKQVEEVIKQTEQLESVHLTKINKLAEKGEELSNKGEQNVAKIEELEKKLETAGPDKNNSEKEKIEKEIKKLTLETEGIEKQVEEVIKQTEQLESAHFTKINKLAEKGEELSNKGEQNVAKIEELEKKLETSNDKNYEEKEKIEKEIKKLTVETKGIEKQLEQLEKQYEKLDPTKLENDFDRLENTSFWVGPKALAEGHKSLTKKNDMRDISQKMFNATFEEKQMLCSEYAVKSQLATIDQLNKLTSYDLMAAGFIDKEEKIIKNLVSSKEKLDRVHPGRLVEILKESGAVTKIETNANKFINTEKLDVSKKTNKDHAKPLSDKIYSILKESTSKEDFQKKSFEATDKYLDSYEVNKETKDAVKTKITSKELPELYDQFKQKPKGIKAKIKNTCKKALEFCKIIKVDRNIKQNIEQIISSPKTEEPVKKVASSEQKVESLKQSTDVEKVPGTDLKKLPNKKDQQLMEGQDAPTPKKNVFAKAFDKFKTTVKERFNEIKPKVTEGNQKIKEAPSDIQEKMTDVKAKVPSFKSLAEINQQQPIAPNLSRIIPQKQETQPEAPPIPPRKQETTPEVPPLPPRKQETTPEVPPLPPRKQETTPEVPPLPPRKQETTPEVPPLPPRKQETTPEVPPLPPRKQETTPEVPPLPPRKQETKPEIPPIPPPKPSIDKMREALSSRSSSNTMTSKPPPLPQRPNKGGGMSMG